MSEKLYYVMTQTETECVVIDENVTKHQAAYLAHWHSETLGKTYHWKEPVDLGTFTPDPAGFDLETIARNEFEEDRANHDARAKWVDRAGGSRRLVATGNQHGFTAVSPEMGLDHELLMMQQEEIADDMARGRGEW